MRQLHFSYVVFESFINRIWIRSYEISEIGESYEIDAINDLIPVCPNCHSMLHQRKPCSSIDELKKIRNNSI